MTEQRLTFRPATDNDLSAEHEVFVAAHRQLWHRHRLEWSPPPVDTWSEVHRHLLAHDGERSFVALDGERLVGFSAAWTRGDTWFLAALFVSPEYQGRQVGRDLLDHSWGDHHRRMTITDSIQPVSTGMYARRGLIPTTPILTLSGTPICDTPRGLEATRPETEALAQLDGCAYGFERPVDHQFWGERSTAANLWLHAGEPIAYSYVDDQGRIGPLAGRNEEAAAIALRAELARRQSARAEVLVPGSGRRLVETGLASGLRATRPPGLLLLSEGIEPPQALAISGDWLF